MSERVQYQLRFLVSKRRFKTEEEAEEAREEARRQFFLTGRSIPGVKIVARWRNPDRATGRRWRTTDQSGQSLREFWETLASKLKGPGRVARQSQGLRRYHAEVRRIQKKWKKVTYAEARKTWRKTWRKK